MEYALVFFSNSLGYETATGGVKVLLKIPQNLEENICVAVSFFSLLQLYYKRDSNTSVFL